jgi:hypothetical protein
LVIDEIGASHEPIVFDYTELEYDWGNYISGLFIPLMEEKIEFNIIVKAPLRGGSVFILDLLTSILIQILNLI